MQVRSNAKAFIFYRLLLDSDKLYPLRRVFYCPLKSGFLFAHIFFNPNGLSLQRRFLNERKSFR